ncbi:hypothetical protein LSAT2_002706 [Lamellibrachia satsuma]|nr:hypothetical protein LSAT2_002706 [Lamellibrachia satsuma]
MTLLAASSDEAAPWPSKAGGVGARHSESQAHGPGTRSDWLESRGTWQRLNTAAMAKVIDKHGDASYYRTQTFLEQFRDTHVSELVTGQKMLLDDYLTHVIRTATRQARFLDDYPTANA